MDQEFSLKILNIKFDIRIITIWLFISNIPSFLGTICSDGTHGWNLVSDHRFAVYLTIIGLIIIPFITYIGGTKLDNILNKIYILNQRKLNYITLTLGIPLIVFIIEQIV